MYAFELLACCRHLTLTAGNFGDDMFVGKWSDWAKEKEEELLIINHSPFQKFGPVC